jgi:hypothetical protein
MKPMWFNSAGQKESEKTVSQDSKLYTTAAAQKYTRADVLFCVYCSNLQQLSNYYSHYFK